VGPLWFLTLFLKGPRLPPAIFPTDTRPFRDLSALFALICGGCLPLPAPNFSRHSSESSVLTFLGPPDSKSFFFFVCTPNFFPPVEPFATSPGPVDAARFFFYFLISPPGEVSTPLSALELKSRLCCGSSFVIPSLRDRFFFLVWLWISCAPKAPIFFPPSPPPPGCFSFLIF